MDYLTNIRDVMFLDGREYADKIRSIPDSDRKWWQKLYLWFHDNFEMIMIAGGCILLALLLISWLREEGGCSTRRGGLIGGGYPDPDNKSNTTSASNSETENVKPATGATTTGATTGATTTGATTGATTTGATNNTTKTKGTGPVGAATNKSNGPTTEKVLEPKFIPKTESQIKTEEKIAAAKKKQELILSGAIAPDKTTSQKMRAKFLSSKAEKNISAAKESIKGMPGRALTSVAGKSAAAWQSVKSGEALELGKEKFENAISNAGDFAKAHAKAGYVLAFTTFMVIGFGLFFVPTLIMFIIGALTLMIFNKQKLQFLTSV